MSRRADEFEETAARTINIGLGIPIKPGAKTRYVPKQGDTLDFDHVQGNDLEGVWRVLRCVQDGVNHVVTMRPERDEEHEHDE